MYKTDFITDYALRWLDEAFEEKDPFFLYLPYHAAHYPLQARPEDIKNIRGKYLKRLGRNPTGTFCENAKIWCASKGCKTKSSLKII